MLTSLLKLHLCISLTDLHLWVWIDESLISFRTYKLHSKTGPKGDDFNACCSHKLGHFPRDQNLIQVISSFRETENCFLVYIHQNNSRLSTASGSPFGNNLGIHTALPVSFLSLFSRSHFEVPGCPGILQTSSGHLS